MSNNSPKNLYAKNNPESDEKETVYVDIDMDMDIDIDSAILDEMNNLDPNILRQYTVLVLGERGVGKTSFIRALKEYITNQPQTFSESHYSPTKTTFTEYIPRTNTKSLNIESILANIEKGGFCREVSRFIMNPHFDGIRKYNLLDDMDIIQNSLHLDREVGEIMITEFSSTTKIFPHNFADCFDRIIIMGEYSDITTLRSIQYWVELVKAQRNKTIVCVNKCDLQPISIENDFHSRKAKALKHFSDQCALEFISVKNCANIGFLYKYI